MPDSDKHTPKIEERDRELRQRIEALTATFAELLDELEEYFGDRMDVTDDEHGGVRPNQAMRFHQRIGEIKRRT